LENFDEEEIQEIIKEMKNEKKSFWEQIKGKLTGVKEALWKTKETKETKETKPNKKKQRKNYYNLNS